MSLDCVVVETVKVGGEQSNDASLNRLRTNASLLALGVLSAISSLRLACGLRMFIECEL